MRRNAGRMWNERFLGDIGKKVIHDLDNEKPSCCIEEIISIKKEMPFNDSEKAVLCGYSRCKNCFEEVKERIATLA